MLGSHIYHTNSFSAWQISSNDTSYFPFFDVILSLQYVQSNLLHGKNDERVQDWWKQNWTMLCFPHCSMLSTILFSIVTPGCGLNNAEQYCRQHWTMQQNILQSCFHQPWNSSSFFAVYSQKRFKHGDTPFKQIILIRQKT